MLRVLAFKGLSWGLLWVRLTPCSLPRATWRSSRTPQRQGQGSSHQPGLSGHRTCSPLPPSPSFCRTPAHLTAAQGPQRPARSASDQRGAGVLACAPRGLAGGVPGVLRTTCAVASVTPPQSSKVTGRVSRPPSAQACWGGGPTEKHGPWGQGWGPFDFCSHLIDKYFSTGHWGLRSLRNKSGHTRDEQHTKR